MKNRIRILVTLLSVCTVSHALDSVPKVEYRQRRAALAAKMKDGVAILFANEEPTMEYQDYRQDEDFYYLTGWNEPGAAMVVIPAADAVAETPGTGGLGARAAQPYREILFLPSRNPRVEKYTGAKMDAATPGAAASTSFDEVLPMTELPEVLNKLALADRTRMRNVWVEKDSAPAHALLGFTAATLGISAIAPAGDVSEPLIALRAINRPPRWNSYARHQRLPSPRSLQACVRSNPAFASVPSLGSSLRR